jgi:hypothetical protein
MAATTSATAYVTSVVVSFFAIASCRWLFFNSPETGGISLLPVADACYVYPADVRDPCAGKTCSYGARCVASLDGHVARCQCPETCSSYGDAVGSTPVCGTNGVDYPSMCELQKAACREMKDISVKYEGKCGKFMPLLFRQVVDM